MTLTIAYKIARLMIFLYQHYPHSPSFSPFGFQ